MKKDFLIKYICKKDSSSLKQKELKESGKFPVFGASGIAGYLDSYHQENTYIGIVKDGSGIGRVAFYPEKSSLIGTMQYILPKDGFDIRYIGYCLQSLDLSKYKQGAAIPHIYFSDYGERKVKVTEDLSEQSRIVSRLDAAYGEIEGLKAKAEAQLREARTLFQAALTQEMKPKQGWEEKKLGEVTSEIGDGLHGTPKYSENGRYYFVNGNNLENGIIEIKENTKRVNDEEFEKYKVDLNVSTVLLSINGTIGKTAFYNEEPIILGKSACYINVLSSLLKEFLRYYLLSDNFMNYARSNSRQATITNLGLKEIRNMPIPLPPLSVQQSIVSRLDALSEKVRELEKAQKKVIAECDALKQALLREVFE